MTVATRPLFTGSVAARTPGTWTPDGSPVTIDNGAGYKAFPGVARLGPTRLLLVYFSATNHAATDSVIKGRIWTYPYGAGDIGAAFTIYDHPSLGVRCEDAVSVVDGKVCVLARLFNGTANNTPFLLIAHGSLADLTSTTTWTIRPITFAEGDDESLGSGRVIKVGDSYLVGTIAVSGSTFEAGVLINGSLTDWSSPTYVAIGSSGQLSEICIGRLSGPNVLALIRRETGASTYKATSTDQGATWSSPAAAHDGFGFPAFRRLTDSTLLTAYRDSPAGDNAWRTSSDSGGTWSSETILDTTGTSSEYASMVQLDHSTVLCVYSVEVSSTDADIYSQVFTRS